MMLVDVGDDRDLRSEELSAFRDEFAKSR